MSVMDMWSICDRCGFKYRRRQLRKENTGWVVCSSCYDGKYSLKSHPQNKPPKFRREMKLVPNGRPDVVITVSNYILLEDGSYLLAEDGSTFILE